MEDTGPSLTTMDMLPALSKKKTLSLKWFSQLPNMHAPWVQTSLFHCSSNHQP